MTPEKVVESGGSGYRPLRMDDVEPRTMKIVEDFIESIPDLPIHVHGILKVVSDIDSDAKEIARLASSDPALVSKILKAVNSSYFGLSRKIDDLPRAIALLGYREIRKMAIQSGFSNALRCMYDTRDIWKHSYLVSICAESIVTPKHRERSGVLLTLGILHDIGKFLLNNPVLVTKLQRKPSGPSVRATRSLMEREDMTCGINHALVGKLLTMKWGLPDTICSTLEHHHDPSFDLLDTVPDELKTEISYTCIADLLVNLMSDSIPGQVPGKECFDLVGLKYPPEENITDDLRGKYERAKSFLVYIE
jgi:HD-like signal output (HDOD) protein